MNTNYTSNDTETDEFEAISWRFKKEQMIPLSVVMFVGFFANSMVIINGIRRRKMIKYFINYFVLSMALADWCVTCFTIPVMFVEYLVGLKWMHQNICSYVLPIRETFQGAAIFSVSTLAVLRVRQVLKNPLKQFSKMTCRLLVAAIWIISFLVGTGPLLGVYKINEHGICDPKYSNPLSAKIHLTIITCILIAPMLIATVSYGTVIVKVSNFLGSDPEFERTASRNRSIALLLIMLILSCWISYTPLGVFLLIDIHGEVDFDNTTVYLTWQIISILFLAGSALNPILVLLTMPNEYRCSVECRRQRVGVHEPNAVAKQILKSTFVLREPNIVVTEEVGST